MKLILYTATHFILVTIIAGCQTTDTKYKGNISDLEASLINVSVSLPPRNPFSGFRNIPQSLSDLDPYLEAATIDDIPLSEWVEKRKKEFKHVKNTRDIYPVRNEAERLSQRGQPRHAAAMLKSMLYWDNPEWTSSHMGSNAYLATFYGAYGELALSRRYLRAARRIYQNDSQPSASCRKRNEYWMYRARAYLALSEVDSLDVIKYASIAKDELKKWRFSAGGACAQTVRLWRDTELDVILSSAYYQIGDFNKAESFARKTFKYHLWTNASNFQRKALLILGKIKLRQGRYQDALSFALMAKGSQRFTRLPLTAPERGEANRDAAIAMIALGDLDDAYSLMEETRVNLITEPAQWSNLFEYSVDRALILKETGHRNEALDVLKGAVDKLSDQFGSRHYYVAEARVLLAQVKGTQSLNQETRSIESLLRLWNKRIGENAGDQSEQSIRLKWIIEDYLVRVFKEKGDLKVALEIAENLRSGQVNHALTQTALRRIADNDSARNLLRQKQNTVKKLATLHKLKSSSRGYVTEKTISELDNKISFAEHRLSGMTASLRKTIPNYDANANSAAFKISSIVSVLEPDEAVVSLLSGRKGSFVWTITGDGKITGHHLEKTRAQWNQDVEHARSTLTVPGNNVFRMEAFDTKAPYAIYRDLLEPTEDHWGAAKHLIVVTDNDLATLPFSMLLTRKVDSLPQSEVKFAELRNLPWLLNTHATSLAPSLTSISLLRRGSRSRANRLAFLGIGDPVFNKVDAANRSAETRQQLAGASIGRIENSRSLENLTIRPLSATRSMDQAEFGKLQRLPASADEIISIANIVGSDMDRDILIGEKANESTIRKMNAAGSLRKYRIISFATHGLIPGELDGLLSPALALSAPLKGAKGDWDDGLLTAEEIMELDLDADWTILSACNTGAAVAYSTEAFSGLGYAFFYAGARSLLLSNWAVIDASTRHLMESVFRNESATKGRAQALRSASLELMNMDVSKNISFAHPLFWAPFTLVGDGGI